MKKHHLNILKTLLPTLFIFPSLRAEEPPPPQQQEQESPVGTAAAESVEESKISAKTWRRITLITAGVAVAAVAIYSVSHNQGKEVCR